jgi:hypothetical protein
MSAMLTEVYDAFVAAGVPDDRARAAAEALRSKEPRFDVLDRKIDRLDASVTVKIDRLETKMDRGFIEADRKLERFEAKVETRFAKVEGELVLHRWILGTVLALLSAIFLNTFLH